MSDAYTPGSGEGRSVGMDAVSGSADALRQAAEAGDAEATWQYAVALLGVTIAPPEPGATLFPQLRTVATALEDPGHQDARGWVQRSADAGNTHAMVVEAVLLGRTDRQRAERLAGQAADRGDTAAMVYLAGLLAADGNRPAARDWYARLADLGDHAAMALLGEMLLDEDPKAARTWLRRAADAGIVRAQNDLARLGARQYGLAPVVKMKRGQETYTFVNRPGARLRAGIIFVAAAVIVTAVVDTRPYNGILFKILWAVGWFLFAALGVRFASMRVKVRGGQLIVRNYFRTRKANASEVRGITWDRLRRSVAPRVHLAGGSSILLSAIWSYGYGKLELAATVERILSLLGVQLPVQEEFPGWSLDRAPTPESPNGLPDWSPVGLPSEPIGTAADKAAFPAAAKSPASEPISIVADKATFLAWAKSPAGSPRQNRKGWRIALSFVPGVLLGAWLVLAQWNVSSVWATVSLSLFIVSACILLAVGLVRTIVQWQRNRSRSYGPRPPSGQG
jgi:hypothetical protein